MIWNKKATAWYGIWKFKLHQFVFFPNLEQIWGEITKTINMFSLQHQRLWIVEDYFPISHFANHSLHVYLIYKAQVVFNVKGGGGPLGSGAYWKVPIKAESCFVCWWKQSLQNDDYFKWAQFFSLFLRERERGQLSLLGFLSL